MSQYKVSVLVDAQNRANKVLQQLDDQIMWLSKRAWEFTERNTEMLWKLAIWWASVTALFWWIAKWAVDSAARFEQMSTAIETALWSKSEAQSALKMIQEISAKTPFEVDQLTASYLSLANRWFKPTAEQITKLWDLASSQAKWFDQLTEAVLDAQQWEFERLKEFWVRAESHWNKVAFTFRGVTTTVDKTSASISDYIVWLWNLEWIQWWMAKQSQTLIWLQSTRSDTLDMVSRNIWLVLLPYLRDFTAYWIKIVEFVSGWIAENPKLSAWVIAAWIALWWLATALSVVWFALPWIIAWFTILTWPIWLAVVAITALWVARWTNFLWIREKTQEVIDFVGPYVKDWIEKIRTVAVQVLEWIKSFWDKWWTDIIAVLTTVVDVIWTVFKTWFENARTILKWAFDVISNTVEVFVNLFSWNFQWAWENIKNIFETMWKVVIDVFSNTLWAMWDILDWILWSIMDRIRNTINTIKSMIASVAWNWWWSSVSPAWIAWQRANWWPVNWWSTYLVWERWPELFTPSTSWNITPNWWFGNITINFWGVAISNWMELDQFWNYVEKAIIQAVWNLQKGIY